MLQKGLKVRMININGIQNKTEHVIKYMGKEKADIMILVETWLRPGDKNQLARWTVCDTRKEMQVGQVRGQGGL